MSRLIDADALIEFIDMGHLRNPLESCFSERDVVDMLESRPTVDAVPVVRCWECKYRKYDDIFGMIWCNHDPFTKRVKSNDFCSYGDRKEGTKND